MKQRLSEQYRFMVRHRPMVWPSFARISVNEGAVNLLPDDAVPEVLVQSAQAMPEAAYINTTMHGPANRFAMTHCQEHGNNQGEPEPEAESDADASDENGDDAHHAAHSDGVDSHHAASHYNRPQETLNENEIIIGISEENWPKPLRLLEAWSASMQKLEGRSSQIR